MPKFLSLEDFKNSKFHKQFANVIKFVKKGPIVKLISIEYDDNYHFDFEFDYCKVVVNFECKPIGYDHKIISATFNERSDNIPTLTDYYFIDSGKIYYLPSIWESLKHVRCLCTKQSTDYIELFSKYKELLVKHEDLKKCLENSK